MPPSTTMHSTIIDSIRLKLSGLTKPWKPANSPPASAAEGRAHGERQQLDVARVDAHRLGGDLVLADRHPGAADARILQAQRDENDQQGAAPGTGSSRHRCTEAS